jgi:hypothetical protein
LGVAILLVEPTDPAVGNGTTLIEALFLALAIQFICSLLVNQRRSENWTQQQKHVKKAEFDERPLADFLVV